MDLNPNQLHTLRHMLGINTPDARVPNPYRDYACANPGDPEYIELERLGAVQRYEARCGGSYHWYRTTDAGRAAALLSHRTIRRTKSQRVYSKFLDVRDAWSDVTFKQFLTHPDFAQARKEA